MLYYIPKQPLDSIIFSYLQSHQFIAPLDLQMQRMVQEMLLMILGEMTVAVLVVFNLLAKLEEIDILGVLLQWEMLSRIILFPHKERLNGNINMSDVQVNIFVIWYLHNYQRYDNY